MEDAGTVSAVDVAAALIKSRPGIDQMQLHKLLYLVQASSLAWFDTPAYEEAIEAWIYGPVTRTVAGHYKQYGNQPIERPASGDEAKLSKRTKWIVGQVVNEFGDLDGFTLADLLKQPEGPWHTTRRDLPEEASSDREIPLKVIADYHRVHGIVPEEPTPEENGLAQRFFDGDDEALAELFETSTGVRTRLDH